MKISLKHLIFATLIASLLIACKSKEQQAVDAKKDAVLEVLAEAAIANTLNHIYTDEEFDKLYQQKVYELLKQNPDSAMVYALEARQIAQGGKNKADTNTPTATTTSTSNWLYEEEINQMDDSKKYYATITATKELHFDFPYNGGSTASLILRNKEGRNDVMLSISKGQFMTPSYDEYGTVRVRFDSEKPTVYNFTEPADHSSDLIFINNEKQFINKLKQSKKLVVECEFYQEGKRTIEFITDGFTWEH